MGWQDSWRASINVSPDTNKQTKTYKKQKYRVIHYQNEVEKCDLIRRLKLDIEELETKLEGREFHSGITSAKKRTFKRSSLNQRNEKYFVVMETRGGWRMRGEIRWRDTGSVCSVHSHDEYVRWVWLPSLGLYISVVLV